MLSLLLLGRRRHRRRNKETRNKVANKRLPKKRPNPKLLALSLRKDRREPGDPGKLKKVKRLERPLAIPMKVSPSSNEAFSLSTLPTRVLDTFKLKPKSACQKRKSRRNALFANGLAGKIKVKFAKWTKESTNRCE